MRDLSARAAIAVTMGAACVACALALQRWGDDLVRRFTPATSCAQATAAVTDMVAVAVALEAHRRAHGEYPRSGSDPKALQAALSPTWLSGPLPADPWGRPLDVDVRAADWSISTVTPRGETLSVSRAAISWPLPCGCPGHLLAPLAPPAPTTSSSQASQAGGTPAARSNQSP